MSRRREKLTICQGTFLNGGDLKGRKRAGSSAHHSRRTRRIYQEALKRGKRKVSFFCLSVEGGGTKTHPHTFPRGQEEKGRKGQQEEKKFLLPRSYVWRNEGRGGKGKVGHVGSRFAAAACSLKGGKPLFPPVWLSNQGGRVERLMNFWKVRDELRIPILNRTKGGEGSILGPDEKGPLWKKKPLT